MKCLLHRDEILHPNRDVCRGIRRSGQFYSGRLIRYASFPPSSHINCFFKEFRRASSERTSAIQINLIALGLSSVGGLVVLSFGFFVGDSGLDKNLKNPLCLLQMSLTSHDDTGGRESLRTSSQIFPATCIITLPGIATIPR